MVASYTYLPWVRQGLISALKAGSTISGGRIQLPVTMKIGADGVSASEAGPVSIQLIGPGDVTGFDARQVIRTDPPNFASDFESNYFPFVEFDRPDFPWIFTPEAADTKTQLKPWICLIVVERRDGVEIKFKEGQPLPVLSITTDAYKELPDLSESWAWAHAQVGGLSAGTDVQNALKDRPELTLSRLLSPRRLKDKMAYYACVVPRYHGGLQAGLGETVEASKALELSWEINAANPLQEIRLPVYYHWEFATGAQGDFESLIWQLEKKQLTFADVGTRKLDISHADYDLSVLPANDPVDLQGALSPGTPIGSNSLIGPFKDYRSWLQSLVNGTVPAASAVLPPPMYGRWHAAQRAIPDKLGPGPKRDLPWLHEINLDPHYRVAAGIGAEIVRDQQEQLMASAWEQVGDIERANMKIREAQLARAASTSIHQKRLGPLDDETFLLITGPLQTRVRYEGKTVRGQINASALPQAVTSVQFRRMLRPRGAIARRFGIATTKRRNQLISGLNRRTITPAPQKWPTPNGMLTMESLLDRSLCNISPESVARVFTEKWSPEDLFAEINRVIDTFVALESAIDTQFPWLKEPLAQVHEILRQAKKQLERYQKDEREGADFTALFSIYKRALDLIAEARQRLTRILLRDNSEVLVAMEQAMTELPTEDDLPLLLFGLAAVLVLQSVEPCEEERVVQAPELNIKGLKKHVQNEIDPRVTIPARISSLIQAPGWKAEELDFVLAAPDFPAPMYKALAEQSQEWLLPGLQNIPPNTLALLKSNAHFIEAFMVGLNHEMSRELLWRGFPTDQRGTYFRQFWDPSGRFSPPQSDEERRSNLEAGKDILPIHEWKNTKLGESFGEPSKAKATNSAQPVNQVVLLIRGELLRRYPHAVIYFAPAEWSENQTGTSSQSQKLRNPVDDVKDFKHPIFRGELAPDINFLGFELDLDDVRGTEEPDDNKPGWFIVFEQQPTEPRFGLDASAAKSDPSAWTWRDLSWVHVNLTVPGDENSPDEGYIQLTDGPKSTFPTVSDPPGLIWNKEDANSAQIAAITLQRPVRVAVHASDLLPLFETSGS